MALASTLGGALPSPQGGAWAWSHGFRPRGGSPGRAFPMVWRTRSCCPTSCRPASPTPAHGSRPSARRSPEGTRRLPSTPSRPWPNSAPSWGFPRNLREAGVPEKAPACAFRRREKPTSAGRRAPHALHRRRTQDSFSTRPGRKTWPTETASNPKPSSRPRCAPECAFSGRPHGTRCRSPSSRGSCPKR